MIQLEKAQPASLNDIHALNQEEVPKVGTLPREMMDWYLNHALSFRAARIQDELAGFMIALSPQAPYPSPNFTWFCARWDDFVYIDRIAVSLTHRRRGVGRALYEDVIAIARARGALQLTCEVNLKPLNQGSIDFHKNLGFEQVGEQVDPRNDKVVAMLSLKL